MARLQKPVTLACDSYPHWQRPFDLSATKLRHVWEQLQAGNRQQTEPKHRVKLKRALLLLPVSVVFQ